MDAAGALLANVADVADANAAPTQAAMDEELEFLLLRERKYAGLLKYRWEESKSGPPRKYYTMTEIGIKVLDDLNISWQDLVKAVNKITIKKAS